MLSLVEDDYFSGVLIERLVSSASGVGNLTRVDIVIDEDVEDERLVLASGVVNVAGEEVEDQRLIFAQGLAVKQVRMPKIRD